MWGFFTWKDPSKAVNLNLLHFVAFFHVASLFVIEVVVVVVYLPTSSSTLSYQGLVRDLNGNEM